MFAHMQGTLCDLQFSCDLLFHYVKVKRLKLSLYLIKNHFIQTLLFQNELYVVFVYPRSSVTGISERVKLYICIYIRF